MTASLGDDWSSPTPQGAAMTAVRAAFSLVELIVVLALNSILSKCLRKNLPHTSTAIT